MKTPTPPPQRLRIPELIRQVRAELLETANRHRQSGNATLLRVEKVTLEINIAVAAEESLEGSAGANIWVVDLSSNATKSLRSESIHKVTVEMSVHGPAGAPDALIAGLGLSAASRSELPTPALVPAARTPNPRPR